MPGTKAGGQKIGKTLIAKYGPDYFSKIGKEGAKAYIERQKQGIAEPRGFELDRELAKRAGKIGGTISRRKKAKSV